MTNLRVVFLIKIRQKLKMSTPNFVLSNTLSIDGIFNIGCHLKINMGNGFTPKHKSDKK